MYLPLAISIIQLVVTYITSVNLYNDKLNVKKTIFIHINRNSHVSSDRLYWFIHKYIDLFLYRFDVFLFK